DQTSLRQAMEKRLNSYEDEIQERKKSKFLRDEKDYKFGRIYTFAKRFDQLKRNSKAIRAQPVQSGDETSTESEVEVSEGDSIDNGNTFLEEMQVLCLDQKLSRGRGRTTG
ncbi:hypothetical protein NDU88_003564, partial [Pleurodeles waltl]